MRKSGTTAGLQRRGVNKDSLGRILECGRPGRVGWMQSGKQGLLEVLTLKGVELEMAW